MTTITVSRDDLAAVTEDQVKLLANRLDADDYSNPFEGLEDWHLLRAIAFERPELVEPYSYLLEFEDCDES
ncbi:DUF2555 domain-containing protein [Geitlerinema sp. P-1104]|uniref:DUF2555 domain-containing protein n=1 Tax=Phormidium yuhuli AB48 TaxID=2940671 RepID=A0ABY5AS99_9CYAN|nr:MULTISPECIES: DUF2555 domain-containing protein [Cyanophyceae]MCC5898949.1 DUF2555 domain-containing protein [Phormidium sp. BM_Day4_Bin.17]TVR11642.1 MAG: DUF2555 domain-containing protein [Phormidium sp. GEM2.Bin31]UCJ13897.1 MAG: DUF2555 domain-containing protein [Phormidium sp. PBR-2020]NMG57794.1 DUF2555 domain-containing protein [Geitlerinema sp. P-1104]USR92098.1 DUF2555 domain-containing protein [Phormidium yuhuli AB48]